MPTVLKADYAKWMLDDPRINFAISMRGREPGIDHLGIQVESSEELQTVSGRLREAKHPLVEQAQADCCYARSDKAWSIDPQGIAWETFLTQGESAIYGCDEIALEHPRLSRVPVTIDKKGCCGPSPCLKRYSWTTRSTAYYSFAPVIQPVASWPKFYSMP